jgi:hypothetical protein
MIIQKQNDKLPQHELLSALVYTKILETSKTNTESEIIMSFCTLSAVSLRYDLDL